MNIYAYECEELKRQQESLCFIASMNYPSEEILDASGSVFQSVYAEGFPGRRYYQGLEITDRMEQDCINECLKAFGSPEGYLANVQPNSGCSANMTVYMACLEAGDTVIAPDVASMGHISHSHSLSFIAKYHNVITYGLDENGTINYDEVERLALEHKPRLIICGASNYSKPVDFKRFKEIADKVGALTLADIAHPVGLILTGDLPNPFECDIEFVTSTLQKTLRGPRGAFIIYKEEFDKEIRLATIPSLFGGPLEHQILAKLQCFREAQTDEFKEYTKQVIKNTVAMANTFRAAGIPIVSNDVENHVFCIDVTNYNINGKDLAIALEKVGVVTNCNAVPNDTSFLRPHGLRLGCAAITTRGLKEEECTLIAQCIGTYLNAMKDNNDVIAEATLETLSNLVNDIVTRYPLQNIYPKKYANLLA